jgi:FkbM family methyltransferase
VTRAGKLASGVVLAAASVGLSAWWVVLAWTALQRSTVAWAVGVLVATLLLASTLGLVVLIRTANRSAWWLLVLGVAAGAGAGCDADLFSVVASAGGSRALLRALAVVSPAAAAFAIVGLLLSFPDGVLGPRRRALIVPAAAGAGLAIVASIWGRAAAAPSLGMGLQASRSGDTFVLGAVPIAGSVLLASSYAAAVALLLRGARGAAGEGRARFILVAGAGMLGLVAVAAGGLGRASDASGPDPWQLLVAGSALLVVLSLVVAAVRYHAFGLYRFVGYMADYWIWTAAETAIAVIAVVVATALASSAIGAADQPFVVAGLALATAAVVFPAWHRRRVSVDRRFGQRQPDPAVDLERLRDGVASGDVDPAVLRGPLFDLLGGMAPIVVVEGEAGMLFALPTTDPEIGRHTFIHGGYDLAVMRRGIEALVARIGADPLVGRVVVDVGANIGNWVVPMLVLHGAKRAVALEPEPDNLALLRLTLALNGLTERTDVVPVAASDREGESTLELSASNAGDHRIRIGQTGGDTSAREERRTISVPVRRLDDVVLDLGIRAEDIALVWVDTQGHERHVLSGASKVLSAGVPFVIEFWPSALRRAGALEELVELLDTRFRAIVDLRRHDGCEVTGSSLLAELRDPDSFTDLLLLP